MAKFLWTISKLSTNLGENEKGICMRLFNIVLQGIKDKNTYNVRVSALRALGMVSYKLSHNN